MTSILKITDGTTEIDLLSGNIGFHLDSWSPAIAQLKDGGVYQNSNIAPGKQLVYGQFDTVNEVLTFHINNTSQDSLIRNLQDFMRLLQKARDYWLSGYQDTPIYLIAQSACETNIRYALVHNYQFDKLTNPYGQPFFTAADLKGMNSLRLGIEREHWLANIPGVGVCAEASSIQDWSYLAAWSSQTTTTSGYDLLQMTNGRILISTSSGNRILYSDDDGVNYSNGTGEAASNFALLQASSGRLFAGTDGAIYTSTDGASWSSSTALPVSNVISLVQTNSGRVLAGEFEQIWYSDDDGTSWASLATVSEGNSIGALFVTTTGRIIAGTNANGELWYSDDDGATWTLTATGASSAAFRHIIQLDSGRILAPASDRVLASDDNGATWFNIQTVSAFSVAQLTNGDILIGGTNQVYSDVSGNGGAWTSIFIDTGSMVAILQTTTGKILVIGGTNVFAYSGYTTVQLGREDSCIAAVANKQVLANFTNIYIDDGGVFGSNLVPMDTLPISLLPASPVADDAIYFGINTGNIFGGPFSNIAFDIGDVVFFSSTYQIDWEYYNGSVWDTLTIQDGTNPGSGVFRQTGIGYVSWTPPSDWATVSVNSVTAWWVRARVVAVGGTMTAPTQQNIDIYTVINPYVEIASTVVLGDIPAVARIKVINESDLDGPGGAAPNLYANRIVAGLRSHARGPNFQAYLNISSEQNGIGIVVGLGTNAAFENYINAPSGVRVVYNPTGAEVASARAGISILPSIASDFYGAFHVFLRAARESGSAVTDFGIQLQISSTGAINTFTEIKYLQTTNDFEVLDFGQIKIPPAGNTGLMDLSSATTINIAASAASGTYNLYLYDLILMPVDEWSIDAIDKTNSSLSDIGRSDDTKKFLDIDSLTIPKYPIRALVRRENDYLSAMYDAITPGEAILQANKRQRLWFMAMQTSATGASYSWLSPPDIVSSIQVYKNDRYLALRGDR